VRSKTSDGVNQEAWGRLCMNYAVRSLLCRAARHGDVDPDRVSFTRTRRAARRSGRRAVGDGVSLSLGVVQAIAETLEGRVPRRRLRANLRVVRRKTSNFLVKRAEHRRWPQPTLLRLEAIRIPSPP